jgi:hypothetical protein
VIKKNLCEGYVDQVDPALLKAEFFGNAIHLLICMMCQWIVGKGVAVRGRSR